LPGLDDKPKKMGLLMRTTATDSGQSVLRNRQLLTNNAKLMEDLELAREQVASCEMAHKRTVCQLQEAEQELRPTKAAVNSIKLELERTQKELKAAKYGLETTTVASQEALNKLDSRDTVLLGQVKELLKFQNKSASTIQNLNAELQQVKLALASALAESCNREREFDETLRQLKDVKEQLATAQLQQSSNYNDAVHQLNNMTDGLQNVR
jgi:chromosome segregation ATPase